MNSSPTQVSFRSATNQATVLVDQQDAPVGRKGPVSPKQALYDYACMGVLIPAVDRESGLGARTMGGL